MLTPMEDKNAKIMAWESARPPEDEETGSKGMADIKPQLK